MNEPGSRGGLWTRLAGHPVRIGRLYLTESDCRFTYDPDYLKTGLPGLGRVYAPEIYRENTIIRKRTAFFDFLPPIQSLIPPQVKGFSAAPDTGLPGQDRHRSRPRD